MGDRRVFRKSGEPPKHHRLSSSFGELCCCLIRLSICRRIGCVGDASDMGMVCPSANSRTVGEVKRRLSESASARIPSSLPMRCSDGSVSGSAGDAGASEQPTRRSVPQPKSRYRHGGNRSSRPPHAHHASCSLSLHPQRSTANATCQRHPLSIVICVCERLCAVEATMARTWSARRTLD